MKILITGGAGYIGSHTLLEALKQNNDILVIDSLERGYKEALERVEKMSEKTFRFEQVDLRDTVNLDKVIEAFNPEAVIHFAAYKSVGEGQQKPQMYYENNVNATEYLLQSMVNYGVKRIIFSSSAAVYGPTEKLPITEESETKPISVYGDTKLKMENLIQTYANKYGLEAVAFRYFNAVGAHESGMIGEDPRSSTNLLPLVMQTLSGKREKVLLFGNRFTTRDGSQERDYIHVSDLADAHVKATTVHIEDGKMLILNLSTGTATSCLQVFSLAEEISGKKLNYDVVEPREGDPEILYADNSKAKSVLNWVPKRPITTSIADQWKWTVQNPEGYKY